MTPIQGCPGQPARFVLILTCRALIQNFLPRMPFAGLKKPSGRNKAWFGVVTLLCHVLPRCAQHSPRRIEKDKAGTKCFTECHICPAGCPDYIHGVDLSYNLATEKERRARAVAMRKRAPIRAQEEIATTPTFEAEDIPGSTEEPPVRGTCCPTGIFACAYQMIDDQCVVTTIVHHLFRTTL